MIFTLPWLSSWVTHMGLVTFVSQCQCVGWCQALSQESSSPAHSLGLCYGSIPRNSIANFLLSCEKFLLGSCFARVVHIRLFVCVVLVF